MPREKPSWDPKQYLKFERERTLPCRDLVSRIELESPVRIADLGCGPGNSTAVLAERWPGAEITGVDNSPEMLARASASSVRADWRLSDIREWSPAEPYDLVFSNAVYQWIPNQKVEIPRLFQSVRPGGAFAFQIPSGEGDWTKALKRVTDDPSWRGRFGGDFVDLQTPDLSFYYDLLSPLSGKVDMWQTEYVHIFTDPDMVVEWTSGTALRPLLDHLAGSDRDSFLSDYAREIVLIYTRRADGKVLFPFLRRFLIAYR